MFHHLIAFLAALWLFAGSAFAQTPAVDLYAVKAQVEAMTAAADRGTITRDQAATETEAILAQAESDLGRSVTLDELAVVQGPTPVSADLTWLQKAAGLVTFANTLMALAAIAGTGALFFLFGRLIVDLLKVFTQIPAIVYEGALILSGVGLTVFASTLAEGTAASVALIGALMYGGGFIWTVLRHTEDWKLSGTVIGMILAVGWGITAVTFDSQLIGAFSVAGLMSAFGFSALFVPGIVTVGFKDDAAVPRATLAAFLTLGLFVGAQAFGVSTEYLSTFREGALYVGGFVGYLGVLIIGSKWYANNTSYVLRQFPAVVAGIGAIYLGSVLGIPELQKMGGTLFVLYLLEKPFEIPAGSMTAYAFITLLVCGAIYGAGMWINANLEIAAPYLLFV